MNLNEFLNQNLTLFKSKEIGGEIHSPLEVFPSPSQQISPDPLQTF